MVCPSPSLVGLLSQACRISIGSRGSRKKRDNSGPGDLYDWSYGLIFDGHDDFSNVSQVPWLQDYADMFIVKDPEIESFREGDLIRRLKDSTEFLEIFGEYLTSGKFRLIFNCTILLTIMIFFSTQWGST